MLFGCLRLCTGCPPGGVLLQTSAWPPSSLSGFGLNVTSSEQPFLAPLGQVAAQRHCTLLHDAQRPDIVFTCLLIPVITRTESFRDHCGVPGAWDRGPCTGGTHRDAGHKRCRLTHTQRGAADGLGCIFSTQCRGLPLLRMGALFHTPVPPVPLQSQRAQQGPVAVGSAPTAVTKGLFQTPVSASFWAPQLSPIQETQSYLAPHPGPSRAP